MALTYDEIRAAVLDYVRTHRRGQVVRELRFLDNAIPGKSPTEDDRETALQIFHELYLERIISTGNKSSSMGDQILSWPFYRVTQYGNDVLDTPEYQPHDPSGYLKLLQQQIPKVDAVIVRYLDESLACFRGNTLLASAVTLGCAAEKAMLLLVENFGNAIADPAKRSDYEKDTKSWMISRKYNALWKRLEPLAKSLPTDLGDDLHTILDRVFDLIRSTRNDAGHPTGKAIEREAMRANFYLFPSYCRRVYALMDHFATNPPAV